LHATSPTGTRVIVPRGATPPGAVARRRAAIPRYRRPRSSEHCLGHPGLPGQAADPLRAWIAETHRPR